MANYNFVTIWKFRSPVEKVWKEINDPLSWPEWWRGVESVTELKKGNELGVGCVRRSTWKGKLPYRLSFDSRVELVEPLKRIEGVAYGELNGKGIWTFTYENNITTARYEWVVQTAKPWMNLLSPVARPAFEWNHDVIMNWGAEGLANRLRCENLY